MGHKVNPIGFRLGVIFTWDSRWFADKNQYKNFVLEDAFIREAVFNKVKIAGLTKIEIERSINTLNIILHVVRPGVVIGRGGQGLEELKKFIQQKIVEHRKKRNLLDKKNIVKLDLRVEPVKEPNLNAHFVATQIAEQLEKRLPHKRVVNFALEKMTNSGARGAKIILAGRIAGAEIARRETYKTGTIPLSTLRENIDFAKVAALTKSGYVGVKVWICK
ncbi:30S ribosomal protein S3 [Candidatus Gottesmanbacteria bacterium RIFCSPHIGHO2_02_FULL_39_14]|uniref:Small ribosomal subunit protein uS3 n=2 Tax=Candidatus Gottesmaniibacteriota TaxID=1752720 RepID=A0A1F5ZV21_9BACT|nr:MAG: 30S ribosomal protein S3 [Candidatus Gottesmanbacteria bacterium RIFCSPHIGHO2_02_FULL_39_14]